MKETIIMAMLVLLLLTIFTVLRSKDEIDRLEYENKALQARLAQWQETSKVQNDVHTQQTHLTLEFIDYLRIERLENDDAE